MRTVVVVVAVVLALSGCRSAVGADARSRTAPPHPVVAAPSGPVTAAGTPAAGGPAGPTYRSVLTRPMPTTVQGLALYGDHVAYAQDDRQLVWMDWRTGARVTVYRSTYGNLYLLGVSGRYAEALDERGGAEGDAPGSPRRFVQLDLELGTVTTVQRSPGDQYVGELNDVRIEVVQPPYSSRGDLVEVPQVADSRLRRRLTTHGLVVQASFDGRHRVVWTQRSAHGGDLDGHEVLTLDLLHPGRAPLVLARSPTLATSSPVLGSGFAGWAQGGRQLRLVSTAGGSPTVVAARLALATAPAADRHRVGLVSSYRSASGSLRNRLVILRVDVVPAA